MQGLLTAVPLEEGHRKLESRWKKAYKAGQQSHYLEVTGHGMNEAGGRDTRVQVCLVMSMAAVTSWPCYHVVIPASTLPKEATPDTAVHVCIGWP